MRRNNKSEGFTVIEVALVLAIAGLIFMMIFIALPALRSSQKDAQRRDDVATLLEKVKNYQTNNRGSLPNGPANENSYVLVKDGNASGNNTSWAGFYRQYLGTNFYDPDGKPYQLYVINCLNSGSTAKTCKMNYENVSFPNDYKMLVIKQAQCDGSVAKPTKNPRKIAVIYRLEGSGTFCSNS
ncbi:type II secretion system protein [Candidatus Saccharibacteria bacterium]|nr:type II secretion system protein [Candidatus Saccharibacteria bacterium]